MNDERCKTQAVRRDDDVYCSKISRLAYPDACGRRISTQLLRTAGQMNVAPDHTSLLSEQHTCTHCMAQTLSSRNIVPRNVTCASTYSLPFPTPVTITTCTQHTREEGSRPAVRGGSTIIVVCILGNQCIHRFYGLTFARQTRWSLIAISALDKALTLRTLLKPEFFSFRSLS